jgi:WD40 repeat protein/serine/threonine protein kinase
MSTPAESRDYGRFNELAEEFARRFRSGERPSLQEFVDRLPEMAEEIRELFPALVEIEQAEDEAHGDAAPPPPPRAAAPRLSQIGDYRILREIGRGGMGVVYEADQISLGRRVALKVLPSHVVGDRKALDRFRREAKAAARLHHTNIVPVFEVGRDGELAFYAMQLIQGQGLDQVIDELTRLRAPQRKPDADGSAESESPETVANPALAPLAAAAGPRKHDISRVAESLLTGRLLSDGTEMPAAAGAATIAPVRTEEITRDPTSGHALAFTLGDHAPVRAPSDLSGSAVLPGGTPVSGVDSSARVQPFFRSVAQIGRQAAQGLAHAHARGIVHRDIKPSNLLLDTDGVVWITDFGLAKADDDNLTATGDIFGTLRYMAPERFRGEGDARADIYALGLTLYELLTLRPAYDASDRLKLIEHIKNEEPARPRSIDRRIPRDLETIVLKAIDKDPTRRYPGAQALAEDLRRFLADEPIQARQIGLAERYWRWARHHPGIAVLGGVLTAVLVLVTVGSLLVARNFAELAESRQRAAEAERAARKEASRQARAEGLARADADKARTLAEEARGAAQAETYRATLSEAKALRAAHQPGWRPEALANLARLAAMPMPARRDSLVQLRTEAVAAIGEFDVEEVARFHGSFSLVVGAVALAFSPDGKTLASASEGGELHLWDVATRRHAGTIPADVQGPEVAGSAPPKLPLASICYLPGGWLAYASPAHRVVLVDPSGRLPARPPIEGGAAQVCGLSADRAGRWLAVGWTDGQIKLHDVATGLLRRTIRGDGWRLALSPDGQWLATRGPDNSVVVQRTGDSTPPITLGRHQSGIVSLAFSPDGTTLASAAWDQTARLWDVARRQERLTLRGHAETVNDVAFSPDGAWVATTSEDHTTRIWDSRDGQPLAVLPGPWFMRRVAFSPDGRYLAAGSVDGNRITILYQLTGRRERRRLVGHERGAQCLAFDPRVARLTSGADDHKIIVWDLDSGRPARQWAAHEVFVTALAYSGDGAMLASARGVGGSQGDFSIRLWDAQTGTLRKRLAGHAGGVYTLAFEPTSRRLASGDAGGTVMLFDVDSGRVVRREKAGPALVRSVVFLGGGRHLLVGLQSGSVALFDLEQAGAPRQVTLPDGCYRLVVDSRTSRAIVGGSKGALSALSLPDLAVVQRLATGHDEAVEAIALSPDGRLLATGGRERRVVLRDARTFDPLLAFPAWTGVVKDLAFDASGRWLASAGADSDIDCWDLEMVHDELAALGLAWDQAAPPSLSTGELASAERSRPPFPVIRPGISDPAALEKARRLWKSGAEAYHQKRFLDAALTLQEASAQFQVLRQSRPVDPGLAREHGQSLGVLANSLRDSQRPIEALSRAREALVVYEWLNDPTASDLYNMACNWATVSHLLDHGSPEDREKLAARAVGYLRRAIQRDPDRIATLAAADRDLDPLRSRADFRGQMADALFPRDPFIAPSPLGPYVTLPRPDTAARQKEGYALLAAGRAPEGLAVLASASASDSTDTLLTIAVAALQAWFGKDAELDVTCRRALEYARYSTDPTTIERMAKICSLRPAAERAQRDAALELARKAVKLGKGHAYMPYFQMNLGMAEYRSGSFAEADAALAAAMNVGKSNLRLVGTSAFYRAMSRFRQGKVDEARAIAIAATAKMKPLPASGQPNPLAGGASADDVILWLALKEAQAVIKRDTAAADATGAFKLVAFDAALHGKTIRIESRLGQCNLGFWDDAGDWASWTAQFDKPGGYEVSLELGTIHADAEFVVEIADQKLTGTAPNTGNWDLFQGYTAGRVAIKSPGVQVIQVRAKDPARWKSINLRAIRLEPTDLGGKPPPE